MDSRGKTGSIFGVVNPIKTGGFRMAIAKMVEFPEREANSFTFQKKNSNISAEVLQKSKNVNATQGGKQKKKTNATQQENNIFDFLNTPSARRRFLSKMEGERSECLNLCGEAGG